MALCNANFSHWIRIWRQISLLTSSQPRRPWLPFHVVSLAILLVSKSCSTQLQGRTRKTIFTKLQFLGQGEGGHKIEGRIRAQRKKLAQQGATFNSPKCTWPPQLRPPQKRRLWSVRPGQGRGKKSDARFGSSAKSWHNKVPLSSLPSAPGLHS